MLTMYNDYMHALLHAFSQSCLILSGGTPHAGSNCLQHLLLNVCAVAYV